MTWIWQIFTRGPEISKSGHWRGPLIQSWKSMSLKSTEDISVMTMKNDIKFEEELTCHFKVDMKNLTNFDPSMWKSQIFSFNVLLLRKTYIAWVGKSTEDLPFMKMKRDAKFGEESICRFKTEITHSANLDLSTQKSQNFDFNRLVLSKVYIVWAKNVQRSYLSWHWRVMQNLKKKLTCCLENDLRNLANFHWSTQVSKLELLWDPFV